MKNFILILAVAQSFFLQGQNKLLFTGNNALICGVSDSFEVIKSDTLPESITEYAAVFLFSSAHSILSETDIENLQNFLKSGKGIYIGSENWPLQAESNQLTDRFYSKQTWGNFTEKTAFVADSSLLTQNDTIPSGTTTVAFPLDYRLKVEAWIDDEPLISSGTILGGRIILDGGYSRFYCQEGKNLNQVILDDFIAFLTLE
jgi:hypothetical protein